MPFPNYFNIESDIKLLHQHNVTGIFAEADQSYPTADLNELRAWLFANLAFDPSLNGTALMTEFLVGFYGRTGAPFVRKHMDIWRDAVLESTPPGKCTPAPGALICPRKLTKYQGPSAVWVTPEAVLASAVALKTAVAHSQPQYRPQLDRLWLTPSYLLLYLLLLFYECYAK